mgnify:FL=1
MTEPNSGAVPLHHPLYRSVGNYGGDCFGISLLMEVDADVVARVLEPTPFDFVSAHAWVEAYVYPTTFGMAGYDDNAGPPYGSFGVVVPVRYGEHVGGYYAHCFKNKDYGIYPGREAAGFPIKQAELSMQRSGRVVSGTMTRPTARFDLSLVIDEPGRERAAPVDVARTPNLLLQSIPSVERDEVMLQQIIRRDVLASSSLVTTSGEGAISFLPTPSGIDELDWLANGRVVHGEFFSGDFRGAHGQVVGATASAAFLSRLSSA